MEDIKHAIEQRPMLVPRGPSSRDDEVVSFSASEVQREADEFGYRVINIRRIRQMLHVFAENLAWDEAAVVGVCCPSCHTVHLHLPSCVDRQKADH